MEVKQFRTIDFSYVIARDAIVERIRYYDAIVIDLQREVEERQDRLSHMKHLLSTFQYCLGKLNEDFKR
jgi:hypothetical protein